MRMMKFLRWALMSMLLVLSQSPAIARYIQADPIGMDGGWNRFEYVGGNPLNATDSRGLLTDQDVSNSFRVLKEQFPGWANQEKWKWTSFWDDKDGQLSLIDGSILLNSRFKGSGCMTRNEYGYFMTILFHEGIHQVEGRLKTVMSFGENHQGIYNAAQNLVGSTVLSRGWYRKYPTWDPSFPHNQSNPSQRLLWTRMNLNKSYDEYLSNSQECTCQR